MKSEANPDERTMMCNRASIQNDRQRRNAIILILRYGAIGVVLTVITSWICQFIPDRKWDNEEVIPTPWPLVVPAEWPPQPDLAYRDRGIGQTSISRSHNLERYAETRRMDPTVIAYSVVERRYGLPFRSLVSCEGMKFVLKTGTPMQVDLLHAGWEMPRSLQDGSAARQRVALSPVPTGFAANALIYAALVWSASFAFKRVRALLRARSARCVACGYSLIGVQSATRCPECGSPLAPAATS